MEQKIMAIDEKQMILDMLRDQLEIEGYQVITAANAAEAMKKSYAQHGLEV